MLTSIQAEQMSEDLSLVQRRGREGRMSQLSPVQGYGKELGLNQDTTSFLSQKQPVYSEPPAQVKGEKPGSREQSESTGFHRH